MAGDLVVLGKVSCVSLPQIFPFLRHSLFRIFIVKLDLFSFVENPEMVKEEKTTVE